MDDERLEVIVLGRLLGTASGWDRADDEFPYFYDFSPAEGVPIEAAYLLNVDYNKGIISTENREGKELWREDIAKLCVQLQMCS